MNKKTYQMGVRMDEEMLIRLRRMEDATGISSSVFARAALESILTYFEENQRIVLPFVCVPKDMKKD